MPVAAKAKVKRTRVLPDTEMVNVEYLKDIRGSRLFTVDRKTKYRFDAGANRTHRMPKAHAQTLIAYFGEDTFEVTAAGKR